MNFKTCPKISSILILIFFFSLQITSCFHWNGTFPYFEKTPSISLKGNILYDLETTTQTDFNTEAVSWTLSSYTSSGVKTSSCGGNYIIGGENVLGGGSGYFQRTYSSLPTHNQIYLQLKFYQIDSWDPDQSDRFNLQIDGVLITGWTLSYYYSGTYSLCGSGFYPDFVFTVALAYPHSASSLIFRLVSAASGTYDEYLGFRDIQIEFLTNTSPYTSLCAPGVPSYYLSDSRCSTSCTSSGNSITPAGYGFCFPTSCSAICPTCSNTPTTCTTCPTGSFLIGTTCYPTCDSPLVTKTLGGVINCDTPCPGQYLWWDNTCLSSCSYSTTYGSYPIVGTTVISFQFCTYPCATNEFLYANTSCLSSCPNPLITTTYKGKNFCEYPCTSSQHLYWNGSCLSTCLFPLTSEVQGTSPQQNFCWYPCSETQYLYWNGSCSDSCPYPLTSETQSTSQPRKFCLYSCADNEFLYWNGSCINSCPSPLSSEIQGTFKQRNFCWYKCSETQYLYWNGSCSDTCPSPLTSETQSSSQPRKFCWYPCAETQYLYWNGSCINSCPSPLSPEIQGTSQQRNFCWYTCSETQYLYWNGSCLNICPDPLAPETQSGVSSSRKFCWYLCQPSEYLYWNGSCINSCPSPLSPEIQGTSKQRNFCWYSCQLSEHLYWNGSCIATCPSPLASEIQGASSQQRNFCWYPCQPSEYLYWNESCLSTCPSPLTPEKQQGISSSRNFCWYTCQPSEYLYWNGSCIATCPSPLSPEVQGTPSQQRNFCWYPCQPSEYLYWNESCIGNCPYPLAPEIQGTLLPRNFCWYTCSETDFLYWNGSCINTCPSPLSPETQGITQQRNFCWYTCQSSEYLYWNQSCRSNCPIPLLSFDLSNNQFCFLPCDMPNIYWYQDLSCRSECNFPYNLIFHNSVSQCLKPCNRPSEYFYDLEKECHTTCNPPYVRQTINTIKVCHIDDATLLAETNKIKSTTEVIEVLGKTTSIILKAASVPQFHSPRTPFLIQQSALMQYIRYMGINYPWRVQLLFQSNDASLISLNIDFSIPNKLQDKFDNYSLPDVFEKYDLESNFINNMWDLINTVLLVVLGIVALLLLNKTIKNSPKVSKIITRILQSLRWNILLAMISGGAGEIIFFSSLQIRSTPLDSAISIISFLITLIMIFWTVVVFAICLKLLHNFHLQRQKINPTASSEIQDWLKNWKGYEILYEEIEGKYLFSLAYMAIYIIRTIFFFVIIANFYDYPLAQSIIINVLNFFIFIYLLYYKPLKDIWNTIQLFINEILGNILTICVLILAIMDRAEIEARDSRVTIGNVMIVIMFIFYVLGVVFLVIEGIFFLIEAYKTWKEMRARGIKNPFKMIQILLFGETKTHPEEIPLELSQNSSRMDTSTIHPQRSFLQKPENNHNILDQMNETKGRNSSIISDIPGDSSARFFLPIRRLNPTTIELTESDIRNTEYEMDISQTNRPIRRRNHNQTEQNEISFNEKASELVFSTTPEPTLQPNIDYIRNWGNLKARMKRFNQSIHKIHLPNEE